MLSLLEEDGDQVILSPTGAIDRVKAAGTNALPQAMADSPVISLLEAQGDQGMVSPNAASDAVDAASNTGLPQSKAGQNKRLRGKQTVPAQLTDTQFQPPEPSAAFCKKMWRWKWCATCVKLGKEGLKKDGPRHKWETGHPVTSSYIFQ